MTVRLAQWRQLQVEDAEHRVIVKRESLLVTGCPGTGKTTLMQSLAERLQSQGLRVDIMSKTHCASARAGGKTADH